MFCLSKPHLLFPAEVTYSEGQTELPHRASVILSQCKHRFLRAVSHKGRHIFRQTPQRDDAASPPKSMQDTVNVLPACNQNWYSAWMATLVGGSIIMLYSAGVLKGPAQMPSLWLEHRLVIQTKDCGKMWVPVPPLTVTHCVTLVKTLPFFLPLFPHLLNDTDSH